MINTGFSIDFPSVTFIAFSSGGLARNLAGTNPTVLPRQRRLGTCAEGLAEIEIAFTVVPPNANAHRAMSSTRLAGHTSLFLLCHS